MGTRPPFFWSFFEVAVPSNLVDLGGGASKLQPLLSQFVVPISRPQIPPNEEDDAE